MPLRPDWNRHVPDERLDAFRNRVARVHRGQEEVGVVLVRVEPYARCVGGHLWWRHWHVRDLLLPWTLIDGVLEDHAVHEDRFEGELRDYRQGVFRLRGEVLRLTWCSEQESVQLRESAFDLGPPGPAR